MKSKIIIKGDAGAGKTTLAKNLYPHLKTVYLNGNEIKGSFPFNDVKKDTELIIFDDVIDIIPILRHIKGEYLVVNKPMEEPMLIKMPKIIIVLLKQGDFKIDKRKYDLIKLK